MGPFLAIVPAIVAIRAPEMGPFASSFFDNPALAWITGSLLLFAGLAIIADRQFWSSAAAILISLFGWFLALRGVALLVSPEMDARAAVSAEGAAPLVRVGFGVLFLVGVRLTFVGWIAKEGAGAQSS
jgi:hypothetical protein